MKTVTVSEAQGEELAEEIMDLVGNHQHEAIKERTSIDAADTANYGWFIDGDELGTLITSTKVYNTGEILTTTSVLTGRELTFEDTWET